MAEAGGAVSPDGLLDGALMLSQSAGLPGFLTVLMRASLVTHLRRNVGPHCGTYACAPVEFSLPPLGPRMGGSSSSICASEFSLLVLFTHSAQMN